MKPRGSSSASSSTTSSAGPAASSPPPEPEPALQRSGPCPLASPERPPTGSPCVDEADWSYTPATQPGALVSQFAHGGLSIQRSAFLGLRARWSSVTSKLIPPTATSCPYRLVRPATRIASAVTQGMMRLIPSRRKRILAACTHRGLPFSPAAVLRRGPTARRIQDAFSAGCKSMSAKPVGSPLKSSQE
jgi:hypothetical protein